MSLQDFRARLHHEQFQFAETLAFVAEHYDYQPSAFRNGAVESAAGQNEGSCKTLGLALLEGLSLEETLRAFGEHYRSVLATPQGSDHGNIRALNGVDVEVNQGEIACLIGANGAGKSTTLLSISGLVRPFEGEILFEGQNLLRLPSHKVVGLGIAQSPEGRRVFGIMSVLENLRLGAFCIEDKARRERTLEWIFDLFPRDRKSVV